MSTRIGIREIRLKPEVDVDEFERFVREEASTFSWTEGSSHRFAKYSDGTERSPYILMFEHSLSKEEHEKMQAELNKANPHNQAILDKLDAYIVNWRDGERISTNYFWVE